MGCGCGCVGCRLRVCLFCCGQRDFAFSESTPGSSQEMMFDYQSGIRMLKVCDCFIVHDDKQLASSESKQGSSQETMFHYQSGICMLTSSESKQGSSQEMMFQQQFGIYILKVCACFAVANEVCCSEFSNTCC